MWHITLLCLVSWLKYHKKTWISVHTSISVKFFHTCRRWARSWSQCTGTISYPRGGRLPLLSARPAFYLYKHSPDGATPNWGNIHLITTYYSFTDPEGMNFCVHTNKCMFIKYVFSLISWAWVFYCSAPKCITGYVEECCICMSKRVCIYKYCICM